MVVANTDTMHAGNTRVLRFTVTDQETGQPFDLTAGGITLRWAMTTFSTANPLVPNTVPVLEKGNADIVTNPGGAGTNVADVTLLAADTDNSFVGRRYSELEVLDGSGQVVVVATVSHEILTNVVNS